MNIANNPNSASLGSTRTDLTNGVDARVAVNKAASTPQAMAGSAAMQDIGKAIERDTARLSSLGRLSSLLDDVESAARALSANGAQAQIKVAGQVLTAALAATRSQACTYAIQVGQLAQAQQLNSPAPGRSDVPTGAGRTTVVQVDIGADGAVAHTTKLVRIDAANNTLDGIAVALKSAGIDAAVVEGSRATSCS